MQKLELSLYATNLKNVDGAMGKSDPFAVVTLVATAQGQAPTVLGKTEVIDNTLNPNWTKLFPIDYEFGKPLKIIVSIFDQARKESKNKSIGSAVFEVGEVLGARGNVKAKKLQQGGTLFAHVRERKGSGLLRLQLSGKELKNTEGLMRKSDPFYEISRRIDSAGGLTWDNVFRSETVHDNLNPSWKETTLELSTISGQDLDAPLLITVYDFEGSGKHVLMGQLETSVNGLVAAAGGGAMTLAVKGKTTGKLQVVKAAVSGVAGQGVPQEPIRGAAVVPPAAGKPSFVDYISGGCEINVVVAVDFTGSNGNPRQPGTLHYLDGGKNDYEKAMTAILSILSKYDSDQKYPVLGFGAKFGGVVKHCFQCGPLQEAHGVDGVLSAYRMVFGVSGLVMSSPTVFTEVMRTAAAKAHSALEAAQAHGKKQAYTVLLICTDGAVSDPAATAACLREIQDAPLSIVIVGVGNADFSSMRFLDDLSGVRDIAQFVPFNQHSLNSADLSAATLHEIPNQLVDYFTKHGISPNPPIQAREEEIAVSEQEEEIDLSLDIGESEIIVTSGGRALSSF